MGQRPVPDPKTVNVARGGRGAVPQRSRAVGARWLLGEDHAAEYKARNGLILFGVYSLIYLGFVLINTLAPKLMAKEIIGGVNLAVVYGFGLIVLAIVMGLIYNVMCTRAEDKMNGGDAA